MIDKLLTELSKGSYEARRKMPIPFSGRPKKGKVKAFAQSKTCCVMELHLRSVVFQVLHWVANAVVWNHPRHFELRWKRSVLELLRERRLDLLKSRQFSSDLDITQLLLELLYVFFHLVHGLSLMSDLLMYL